MEVALDKLQLAPDLVTVLCVVCSSLFIHASHFPEDEMCVVSPGQQGAKN